MAVRLRDVAEQAGVSVKTVSNVVNGHQHVATATRERVQAALDALQYRPNLSARNLRRGRSGVIALAVPQIDMPYFAELARYVVEAAEGHGLTVLVDQTDGLAERERLVLSGFRGHLFDGLIMSPVGLGAPDFAGRYGSPPLVLLGEKVEAGATDHVAIDNIAAARDATLHLLRLGRRRIGVVGDQPDSPEGSGVARLRRRGYEMALATQGLTTDRALLAEVPSFGREEGAAATVRLLDSGAAPDALFCLNDTLALGALRVLALRGLRVPQDVAVIGMDDIEDSRWSTPTLSTVVPDKAEIARSAVAMLLDRLADGGEEVAARDVRAGYAVVGRESTLGPG